MAERTKVIIIAGPTASSKSELALHIAEEIGGEIINADSVQVFRYFDIGSAKPSEDFRRRVLHHLIDILDPRDDFNAFKFKDLARRCVADIAGRGRVPVVVGGTGLYIRCFLYGLFVQDEKKIKEARALWEETLRSEGLAVLHRRLEQIDPESAIRIHHNDRTRIVRALEYHTATGMSLSSVQKAHRFSESPYDFTILVPEISRDELDMRIRARTAEIFRRGIIEEVRSILAMGYPRTVKPFKTIGYKEALFALDGALSVDGAQAMTVTSTRAYAKRQRIWFKKEPRVEYIALSGDFCRAFADRAKYFLHKR